MDPVGFDEGTAEVGTGNPTDGSRRPTQRLQRAGDRLAVETLPLRACCRQHPHALLWTSHCLLTCCVSRQALSPGNAGEEQTCGAPRERSTTIESTTTSEQAVLREPTMVAMTAPVGVVTTVAMAVQESVPVHPKGFAVAISVAVLCWRHGMKTTLAI